MDVNRNADEPRAPDAARQGALSALRSILDEGAGLDDALGETRSQLNAARDRAFQRQLVMAVLRNRGDIDHVLKQFLKKPPKGTAGLVGHVLRLGIAQVLFLNVPAYAAASTTVSLVRKAGFSSHAGLVNAIMRRAAEQGRGVVAERRAEASRNTPEWLWESWCAAYGRDTATAIAEAHGREPPLDISLKHPREAEAWAAALGAVPLPSGSLRLPGGGLVTERSGFADGAWWVQDAAAALPVKLLGDVGSRRVLDLCAAPGGKTAQLVAAGARVTALDQSTARMTRLNSNMARLGLSVESVVADALYWRPQQPFDAVLLDAPCSATGTIRRHPDILWNKSPRDVARMGIIQAAMLDAAITMVVPGGYLVYCTCSLQPQEGEQQISRFLERTEGVEPVPIAPKDLSDLPETCFQNGAMRTTPATWTDLGSMDGFFAARLRRTG